MKVLVIGGSGFVGSHVADALSEAGHQVTIFDVRPSPYLQSSQEYLKGDILDMASVEKAVAGKDVVFNFAGQADIEKALAQPLETIKLNVLGNAMVLEASRKSSVKRYLFASTVYVSGNAGGFYRASKQACEIYIEEYQRLFGLSYTILRYGSLYGRRSGAQNGVYHYLRQALVDRRIVCQGTGEEVREYIHVEDAARAAVQVLSKEFADQHVILTGHYPMKVRDLLTMIKDMVGPDVEMSFQESSSLHKPDSTGLHYSITPYAFRPKIAKKLVSHHYLDLGQGLLDCLDEIYQSTKSC
jgi:UDP-glucose 4-epimerase